MRKGLRRASVLGAIVIAACAVFAAAASEGKQIDGAGATFPYPIYSKWAAAYHKANGVRVNYQSIGSGGGIKQIKAGTVDFGASDAPLVEKELDAGGLVQFPMIIGGVVPVVNLPGIERGELKLTGQLLAEIFRGRITRWNDPALQKVNPKLNLPGLPITVVHRSDGSGTTWIFTNYLSKVSSTWKQQVGNAKAVSWPTGVGGKGNEGVASYVARLKGAIGYVEFAYALQNRMNHVLLRNRDGQFVEPSIKTFQAAAAGADWAHAPGFYLVLTNQPGKRSWPISGASFILIHETQDKAATGQAVLEFFAWCLENGNDMAVALHYVPLPNSVVQQVKGLWEERVRTSNDKPIWPPAESRR